MDSKGDQKKENNPSILRNLKEHSTSSAPRNSEENTNPTVIPGAIKEADQQLLEEAYYIYKTQKIYGDGVREDRKRIIGKKVAKLIVESGEGKYNMKNKGKVYIITNNIFLILYIVYTF